MADRDDHRWFGGGGRDRWRGQDRDHERDRDHPQDDGRGGSEHRSFGGGEGRFNSDPARYGQGSRGGGYGGEGSRHDRSSARYDQDRTGYGAQGGGQQGNWQRGRDNAGRFGGASGDDYAGGYGRGAGFGSAAAGGGGGYGGQEYGMEGRNQQHDNRSRTGQSGSSFGSNERESWRGQGNAPYGDLELNARASGVEEFGAPHDYAYHPQQGHEFEHDYVQWREQQMRNHDRDYREWCKHQREQYDNDYKTFRSERRDTFGKNFHEWRSQKNMTGGMREQHITPETGDYAKRGPAGFGGGADRPSGMLESPGAMTSSPSLQQTGGGGGQTPSGGLSAGGPQSAASGESEFGKSPPQVQAASDGGDTRAHSEDREEGHTEDRKH